MGMKRWKSSSSRMSHGAMVAASTTQATSPGASQRFPALASRHAARISRNGTTTSTDGSHRPANPASSPKPAHRPRLGSTSILCAGPQQPQQAQHQQVRGPGPGRGKVDAVGEKRPRPPGHQPHTRPQSCGGQSRKDGDARRARWSGSRMTCTAKMDRAVCTPKTSKIPRHHQRIHRRHNRRGLVRQQTGCRSRAPQ
jgi:hypothetical protein